MTGGRLVGRTMDRRASARRREYRARTRCEAHGKALEWCPPQSAECMVCGCGGGCTTGSCPEPRRPLYSRGPR